MQTASKSLGRLVLKGRDLGEIKEHTTLGDTWDVWLVRGWTNASLDEIVPATRVVAARRPEAVAAVGGEIVCVWEYRGDARARDAIAFYDDLDEDEVLRVEDTHGN